MYFVSNKINYAMFTPTILRVYMHEIFSSGFFHQKNPPDLLIHALD
jgi:hypothetical protein